MLGTAEGDFTISVHLLKPHRALADKPKAEESHPTNGTTQIKAPSASPWHLPMSWIAVRDREGSLTKMRSQAILHGVYSLSLWNISRIEITHKPKEAMVPP